MTSNRLSKVAKHIAKKKGGKKALHENSRDTQRLQRAGALDEKLNKLAGIRKRQNHPYLARVEFFQTAATEHASIFSLPDIQVLIEQYIHRDDEELETLKAERRPGRPASTREDLLKQKQNAEVGEYKSGFWVPDLEDDLNLQVLKEWDGRWASLHKLKFVRIATDGTKKESSFPPKGMS
jgi:translation machinery-associated protein 16